MAGKALIVDDEPANRLLLKMLLKKIGYEVTEAEDGAKAVDQFAADRPDIVFMDVMMPVMDGYEAASRIKALCGDAFVPLIFLTALVDDNDLARCIDAGGDDFMTKPINPVILRSKIRAMERIRDLHREITLLYDRRHQEDKLAERIFSTAVVAENVELGAMSRIMRSLELFSGDVLLTAFRPSGDLHVMLGDFTGHGLASAIGALPVSEIFRTMTAKGFTADSILSEMNRTLHRLLPSNMFMAAQFVSISRHLDRIGMINCGMPEILLLDHSGTQIKQRFVSATYPLGIVSKTNYLDIMVNIPIAPGDQVLLMSDGLVETRNMAGEFFGQQRLEQVVAEKPAASAVAEHLWKSLEEFRVEAALNDDVSIVSIPCVEELFDQATGKAAVTDCPAPHAGVEKTGHDNTIQLKLTLRGSQQLQKDPVPIIISQLHQLSDCTCERQLLFTILNELYMNAFEHGILGLDSSLKNSPDGFDQYYQEREQRLAQLGDAFVQITLDCQMTPRGGRATMRVEDSGPGFDFANHQSAQPGNKGFSGRGIQLVRELCEYVRYEEPGNKVEAVYGWTTE